MKKNHRHDRIRKNPRTKPNPFRIIVIILLIAAGGVMLFRYIGLSKTLSSIATKTNPSVTISLIPPSITAIVKKNETISVYIDTDNHTVSAVDLTVLFDPKILRIDDVAPGDFFVDPTVLIERIDNTSGTLTYAIGSLKPKKGTGKVVTLTLAGRRAGTTHITITENTKVAAIGAGSTNVLATRKGAVLTISAP